MSYLPAHNTAAVHLLALCVLRHTHSPIQLCLFLWGAHQAQSATWMDLCPTRGVLLPYTSLHHPQPYASQLLHHPCTHQGPHHHCSATAALLPELTEPNFCLSLLAAGLGASCVCLPFVLRRLWHGSARCAAGWGDALAAAPSLRIVLLVNGPPTQGRAALGAAPSAEFSGLI